MAGMASSNALLGITHSMAHKTGAAFSTGHIPHGLANAMYLPYVIQYNAVNKRAKERYAEIAKAIGLKGKSATALVNGEPVEITTTVNGESGEDVLVPMPVVERDGKVAALVSVFSEPWEFWSFTTYTSIEEGDNVTIIFGDLVIIP